MNKAAVAAASGVLVIVVGGAVVAAGLFRKGKNAIDVTLQPTANGGCTVSPISDNLGGKKNGAIKWRVTNNCSTSQYIRFQTFRRRPFFGGELEPEDRTTVDPPEPSGTIAPGRGDVDAKINRSPVVIWPFSDDVKYEVWLGTTQANAIRILDPDVEIWP